MEQFQTLRAIFHRECGILIVFVSLFSNVELYFSNDSFEQDSSDSLFSGDTHPVMTKKASGRQFRSAITP
jgi:hypothetical protein